MRGIIKGIIILLIIIAPVKVKAEVVIEIKIPDEIKICNCGCDCCKKVEDKVEDKVIPQNPPLTHIDDTEALQKIAIAEAGNTDVYTMA